MQRIFLVFVTNIAVLALLSLVLFLLEMAFHVHWGQSRLGGLLVLSAAFGFGGALISLGLSKWIAKRAMRVRVIASPQSETETWLLTTVGRLAEKVAITMPEVGIFDADEMNAFATGAHRNAALVAVTSGLLRSMSRAHVEAVLGHEISHVANGDMVTLTLLQGILNTFVIFLSRVIGGIVDGAVLKNDRESSGFGFVMTTMVAQIVLGILASLIVSAFSRHREFRADRGGAELAGNQSMIGALEALKRSQAMAMPPPMRASGINAAASNGFMQLFMTHPPLEQRIAALRGIAALRTSHP